MLIIIRISFYKNNYYCADVISYSLFKCFVFTQFSLVPFCVVNRKFRKFSHDAALCDVATTVLQEMGVAIPSEMTGQPLLE